MTDICKAYEGSEPYIFVSYSHKDTDTVMPILRTLQENGFRIWYDAGIEAGTEWAGYISSHLKSCSCMLCCMSPNAADSLNCRNEITLALNKSIPTLCVYLEDFELPTGLDLQLCNFHALYMYRHKNETSFLRELMNAKLLQACKGESAVESAAAEVVHDIFDIFKKKTQPQKTQPQETELQKLTRLAEAGDAEAQTKLGNRYYNGDGVKKDLEASVRWFMKGAEQGYYLAQHYLGWAYAHGEGVAKDYVKAAYWYRKAAEQGYAKAQNNLGLAYKYGDGVTKDYAEAVYWYRKSAEQGYDKAQNNLGNAYYFGEGVEKNPAQAVYWYQKAADQGNAKAQCNLGDSYYYGEGIAKSRTQAVYWYRKAAEQGNETARKRLDEIGS